MARDYQGEAFQEHTAREGIRRWYQARIEAIRRSVTAHSILRRNGIVLRHDSDREEQIPCPFHGVDTHPSARVYPETVKGPSHVWCFVCQEHWDAIGLWKRFAGTDTKFTNILAGIERAFGLVPPERPPSPSELAEFIDPETVAVEAKVSEVELDLSRTKHAFDMRAHLTLGSILDKVRYQADRAIISPVKAIEVLDQIEKKIIGKERAWILSTQPDVQCLEG